MVLFNGLWRSKVPAAQSAIYAWTQRGEGYNYPMRMPMYNRLINMYLPYPHGFWR